MITSNYHRSVPNLAPHRVGQDPWIRIRFRLEPVTMDVVATLPSGFSAAEKLPLVNVPKTMVHDG